MNVSERGSEVLPGGTGGQQLRIAPGEEQVRSGLALQLWGSYSCSRRLGTGQGPGQEQSECHTGLGTTALGDMFLQQEAGHQIRIRAGAGWELGKGRAGTVALGDMFLLLEAGHWAQ